MIGPLVYQTSTISTGLHPSKTMDGCKERRWRRKGLARVPGLRGIHTWSRFKVVEGYNATILVAWQWQTSTDRTPLYSCTFQHDCFGCIGRRSQHRGRARLQERRGLHIWSSFRMVEGYNGTILVT